MDRDTDEQPIDLSLRSVPLSPVNYPTNGESTSLTDSLARLTASNLTNRSSINNKNTGNDSNNDFQASIDALIARTYGQLAAAQCFLSSRDNQATRSNPFINQLFSTQVATTAAAVAALQASNADSPSKASLRETSNHLVRNNPLRMNQQSSIPLNTLMSPSSPVFNPDNTSNSALASALLPYLLLDSNARFSHGLNLLKVLNENLQNEHNIRLSSSSTSSSSSSSRGRTAVSTGCTSNDQQVVAVESRYADTSEYIGDDEDEGEDAGENGDKIAFARGKLHSLAMNRRSVRVSALHGGGGGGGGGGTGATCGGGDGGTRSDRRLTGRFVKDGTGASEATLQLLREMLELRKKHKLHCRSKAPVRGGRGMKRRR